MRRQAPSCLPAILLAAVAASATGIALIAAPPSTTKSVQASGDTVARFLESGRPPLTAYRARRHLEASSRGGRMAAQLDAWTNLQTDGTFTYEIYQESGSGLIRSRILYAALLEEQHTYNASRLAESAFTRDNYEFLVDETIREGELVRIGLAPRRKSQVLIDGDAFVRREDADLVTIRGVLSKRPSFWTRTVQITRHYARIDGVRVPTEVRLDADMLLVGDSSFAMTYAYTSINGKSVGSN